MFLKERLCWILPGQQGPAGPCAAPPLCSFCLPRGTSGALHMPGNSARCNPLQGVGVCSFLPSLLLHQELPPFPKGIDFEGSFSFLWQDPHTLLHFCSPALPSPRCCSLYLLSGGSSSSQPGWSSHNSSAGVGNGALDLESIRLPVLSLPPGHQHVSRAQPWLLSEDLHKTSCVQSLPIHHLLTGVLDWNPVLAASFNLPFFTCGNQQPEREVFKS